MLLSIGLMVKNESKHLEKCLQSLTPILQEIRSELIVVDTGSIDNTVEIALRYTDKVYHHEWFDDFAGMRNIVLRYTTGKWFFYLDGDEVVEDASGIIRFFKSQNHKKFNAAFIEMRNYYSSKDSEKYGVFQALRFFVKDKGFHFKGIVHEQPQAKGPVARIDGHIVHYGYVGDDKDLMEYKFERNVALLNRVLEKEPDNIYHLFQLSQSYAMYGKHKEALEPIRKAYELAREKGIRNYMNVVTQLANLRFKNKMFVECEAICKEGLAQKDGYVDLYYFQALSQVELGKLDEAVASFQQYLSLVEDYESGKVIIDLTLAHHSLTYVEHAYVVLCAAYKKLGDEDQALHYGTKVTSRDLIGKVIPNLVSIYFKRGLYESLKELYDSWQSDDVIKTALEDAIERKRFNLALDESAALARVFASQDSPYGLLNLVRLHLYEEDVTILNEIWEKVNEIDLRKQAYYFGDILYAKVHRSESLIQALVDVPHKAVGRFIDYLVRIHKDFLTMLKEMIETESSLLYHYHDRSEVSRVHTAILYSVLQQGHALDDENYRFYFQKYLEAGVAFVEKCYDTSILDAGRATWARTSADGFLFVMRRALSKEKTSAEYVQCLREALVNDERMKRGIEFLLEEVQDELVSPERAEIDVLKNSVREAIKEAINKGELDTAVYFINEYEDIVGVDAPLCAFKGIMFMIDGDLEEARNAFLLGLELEPENEDLLYNLSYLDSL